MLSALRQLTSVVLCASAVTTISASILPASGASVAALPDPFLSSLLVLHPRQTGTGINIPPACVSTCGTAPQTFTQSCTPNFSASGCCVESFEMDLFNCYVCIGSVQNITNYAVPQQTLDQMIVACAAVGSPIQKLTLPGQDPNRALATSAGAGGSRPSTQTQTRSQSQSSSTQSQSQSQSTPTATSPSTSSSTPRSPVTETPNGSGGAGGSQTSSGTSAGSAQTSNAGMSLGVGVGVGLGVGADATALGMGSVIGMVVATVLTVIVL
ncbi:hypothetical protein D9758_007521 [Tetrapyrgos nigripes]|uniref:Uncharacterized protein n=1 Tax=Tetrapyrgos nigripes TaxID=182062 RepID=A0A8H5G3H8_9AGAR|nr:hypothetical protein D9758_007521 [Tetrapyrgos nigripes]